jgi:hypothetical protein
VKNVRDAVTPKLRARVLALAAEGLSHRKISASLAADGVSLSHTSVGTVLRTAGDGDGPGVRTQAGAGALGAQGGYRTPRRGRPPSAPSGLAAGRAAAPAGDDDEEPDPFDQVLEADRAFVEGALAVPVQPMPPMPEDATPAVAQAWENLRDARTLLATMRPGLASGDVPMTQFKAALDSAIKAADALTSRMPPPAPDPAKDPVNVAAREMVHAHVLGVIEAVELRSGRWCPRCGMEREGVGR